jgi:hypothetical protein
MESKVLEAQESGNYASFVTVVDYEEALLFYRDHLGMSEQAAFSSPAGRGCERHHQVRFQSAASGDRSDGRIGSSTTRREERIGGGVVATMREQQVPRGGWSRARWLVVVGLLIAVAVVVVLVLTYTGGGSGGGGGPGY